eukprot:COSAG01_NODE_4999_length_4557_cov_15.544674_3_plen_71_part_00
MGDDRTYQLIELASEMINEEASGGLFEDEASKAAFKTELLAAFAKIEAPCMEVSLVMRMTVDQLSGKFAA